MRNHALLNTAAALAVMTSPMICMADNGADNTDGNGGGSNDGGNAGADTTQNKRYAVRAEYRGYDSLPAEKKANTPKEVNFVIEGPDYKNAWQAAREVTRVGTDNVDEMVRVLAEDGGEFKLSPGRYTVREVTSMQERGKKVEPLTVEKLEQLFEANDVKLTGKAKEIFEQLKANPGEALAKLAEVNKSAAAG